MEFYSFGTYAYKEANSYENYRTPTYAEYVDPVTHETDYADPYGYSPQEQLIEEDFQVTAGFKGVIDA